MQLKCSNGHSWTHLANFPETANCEKCGLKGETDFAAPGRLTIHTGINEHLLDPLEKQFWMENRRDLEDKHLSGDRYTERYDFIEKGPKEFRPFGGDDMARKQAEETRGYSPHGKY